jgi:hypothetical protein
VLSRSLAVIASMPPACSRSRRRARRARRLGASLRKTVQSEGDGVQAVRAVAAVGGRHLVAEQHRPAARGQEEEGAARARPARPSVPRADAQRTDVWCCPPALCPTPPSGWPRALVRV